MTPETIDENVLYLVDKLKATHDPAYVEVCPEPGAALSDCFPVVENKAAKDGGRMILGWQIWQTGNLVEAECHAVWETPEGELLDITPKEFAVDKILFVEDENLKYEGKQIDNVRLNITKNPLVDDLILVCETIFAFQNRGKRADVYDLGPLLNEEQVNHLGFLKSLQAMISEMLKTGGTRDSLCGCGSGRKFKNCHGDNLLKNINKVK